MKNEEHEQRVREQHHSDYEPHQEKSHHESGESDSSFRINKHYVLIGIVGLLLVFSLVQAVQLSSVRMGVVLAQVTGGVSSGSATAQSVQQASTASAPAPTMVGGC